MRPQWGRIGHTERSRRRMQSAADKRRQGLTMSTHHHDDLWAAGFSKAARLDSSLTLSDYWDAPSCGPLHDQWLDKPHKLLYDLIGEVLHLRAEIERLK